MGSPPTSSLRFRNQDGADLATPEEWVECWLQIPVDRDRVDEVVVRRQGQQLPVLVRRLGDEWVVVSQWPRSSTGTYLVEAATENQTWQTTVTIEPQKITPAAYRRLVDDLQLDLPAAVAIALQQCGALTGVEILPPQDATVEAELLRLRRAITGSEERPGLATLLPQIASDPHEQLVHDEVWVDRARVRRLRPGGLVAAVAKPNNLDDDHRPKRAPDARVIHTVDVYENRLLDVYERQVELRLLRILRAHSTPADARREAHDLLHALTIARRQASFLDQVTRPATLTARVTMVLLRRPAYRAMFEGYLELHRAVRVRLDHPALESPLENLPALYQLWGTLRIIASTIRVAATHGYAVDERQLVRHDTEGLFIQIAPDGKPAVTLHDPETGMRVTLTPERSFTRASHPIRSVSFKQRPDIVIEFQATGSAEPRLVVFDPKYKLDSELGLSDPAETDGSLEPVPAGRPKKVDIDKMHAYRDAIRGPAGTRVVDYAAILYPGTTVEYGNGVAAVHAYPGAAATLDQHVEQLLANHLRGATPGGERSPAGNHPRNCAVGGPPISQT